MDDRGDEDVQLQHSSGAALSTLTQILPHSLFRAATEQRPRRVRETIRKKDLDRVVALVCASQYWHVGHNAVKTC